MMRKLKDGRIKLKFNELRVGMVLKKEPDYSEDLLNYVLVTSINRGDYPGFKGLHSKTGHHFLIPESMESKEFRVGGNYCAKSLSRHFWLANSEEIFGVDYKDILKYI